MKNHKSFFLENERECIYDEQHTIARNRFGVRNGKETFLGLYNGTTLKETFVDVENFSMNQKDRKKGLQLYLYYPKSYSNIRFFHKLFR